MSLENYTGNISDLVATNPTGTDPRSQGDDHLRGIKYTLKQSFPRATGPINISGDLLQLGDSVTAANNFTMTAEADNGTMKLARGNAGATTQDVMTVDALGKVWFPQLARLLDAAGYVTLPNGIIIQWGGASISTTAANTWATGNQSLPIPFPNNCFQVIGNVQGTSLISSQGCFGAAYQSGLANVSVQAMSTIGALPNIPISFIAIGN